MILVSFLCGCQSKCDCQLDFRSEEADLLRAQGPKRCKPNDESSSFQALWTVVSSHCSVVQCSCRDVNKADYIALTPKFATAQIGDGICDPKASRHRLQVHDILLSFLRTNV